MKIKDFFSNPWIGVAGTVASIFGLILAVYFYVEGKQSRHLMLNLNPSKAVVVKSGQASRLTVSYNGSPITSDITAAQIEMWNAGNTPIRKDNLLDPLTIVIDNAVVLEASIRKVSRPVTQVALNTGEIQKKGWYILGEPLLTHSC